MISPGLNTLGGLLLIISRCGVPIHDARRNATKLVCRVSKTALGHVNIRVVVHYHAQHHTIASHALNVAPKDSLVATNVQALAARSVLRSTARHALKESTGLTCLK